MYSVCLYCVANNEAVLIRDLLRSPELAEGRVPISVIWGASGASSAYHGAISKADADLLIFAHQDIFFPEGWFERLQMTCKRLTSIDPTWAVAGLFGAVSSDQLIGHVWILPWGLYAVALSMCRRRLLASTKSY